jgi:hypothetical protein
MQSVTSAGGDETQKVTKEVVLQHLRAHLVPASPGRRCVDGRYQAGQASGRLARPGADLGYLLATLAACRARGSTAPATEIADAVFSAVTADGGGFALHTDEATGVVTGVGQRPKLGCLHVTAALDPANAGAYYPGGGAAASNDAATAVGRILERRERGDRVEIVTLYGKPRETAVLIVSGTGRSVEPGQAGYLVFDETRDRAYMADVLAPRLTGLGISFDDLEVASRRQLAATLQIAAPHATVWRVDLDGPEPVIEPVERASSPRAETTA